MGVFASKTKYDCTHVKTLSFPDISKFADKSIESCKVCKNPIDNMLCMTCGSVLCNSNKHAGDHYLAEKHPIFFNFKDLTFWCNECKMKTESYVLNPISKLYGAPMSIEYSVEGIAKGIKEGYIKKIVVMAGAGLSVSAGIPDFRSPSSGLYSKLQEFHLPYPEAVFTMNYFKKNPRAFYAVVQPMVKKYFPTKAHYLLRLLQDKGILLKLFTQNIDGLEIDAGIRKELVTQAHGKVTSSHCISCHFEVSQDLMAEHLLKGEPLYCPKCKEPCKPDVVLFGESLPKEFYQELKKVGQSDLIIVIGTSLQVAPFSDLIKLAKVRTPRLIIDKVITGKIAEEKKEINVIMKGEADKKAEDLIKMLGYEAEFEALMKEREGLMKKYEEDKAKGIAKVF